MSKKQKISVSVSNDLSTDQRVHRVCASLYEIGYNVELIGRKLKNSRDIDQRQYKHKRLNLFFNKGFLFYFCLNIRLFFYLLFSKQNILLANDLDTLLPNFLVSKIKRKKLFYDSHELFTEVPELNNRKFVKKIWLSIEKICLPGTYKAYTVCDSIAEYYRKKYRKNFFVVRNLPYYHKIENNYLERENIIIYQGALNKDRGIELMIKSMQHIDNYKLFIAGDGDIASELIELSKKLNLSYKVKFLGKLDFNNLRKITSTAVLGLSLEQNTNLNYYYSLPNKVFDYINAGVPVLCSDLPEMRNIINNYQTGILFKGTDEKKLAKTIIKITSDRKKLLQLHHNCIKASKELCWENEKTRLNEIFVGFGF